MKIPLNGLLLAGGKSSRMGRDKASMIIGHGGLTQASRALDLLRLFCQRTFLSLGEGQPLPEGGLGLPVLRDSGKSKGPLRGLLAAFREEPASAWLVLACDLPLVTAEILARLVRRHREKPREPFVAYANPLDGLPEPLCAIYGPSAFPLLQKHATLGNFSPRRILTEENAVLLDMPPGDHTALTNINTPGDVAALSHAGS